MTTLISNITLPEAPTSQLTHHDFTGYCLFNGKALACGGEGLYELGGGEYNGEQIDAWMTLPTTDHGKDFRKSYRYAYIHGEFGGDMEISALCDSENEIGPFVFTADPSKGRQCVRTQMGRGLYFDYGAVTISNVDGAFFSLDRVDVVV